MNLKGKKLTYALAALSLVLLLTVFMPGVVSAAENAVDVLGSLPNGAWETWRDGRMSFGEVIDFHRNPFMPSWEKKFEVQKAALFGRGIERRDIRGASIVLSAYNSVNRSDADLYCDGTFDEVQENGAEAIVDGIGGTVFHKAGQYNIQGADLTYDTPLVGESSFRTATYGGVILNFSAGRKITLSPGAGKLHEVVTLSPTNTDPIEIACINTYYTQEQKIINNVTVRNTDHDQTGTGIYIHIVADAGGSAYLELSSLGDIAFHGLEYGLRIHTEETANQGYYNGNSHGLLSFAEVANPIWYDADGTSEISGNVTEVVQIQGSGVVNDGITMDGQCLYNHFPTIMAWDWATSVGQILELGATANYNLFVGDLSDGAYGSYCNNNGTENELHDTRSSRVLTVKPYFGDYDLLSAALTAAPGDGATILVYGDITETVSINPKTGVDVIGFHATITTTDRWGIYVQNDNNFVWRNLTFIHNHGIDESNYALYIGGVVPNTARFEHCKFINSAAYDGSRALYVTGASNEPIFKDCEFTGGTAGTGSVAVFIEASGAPFFDDCRIEARSADAQSYGVYGASTGAYAFHDCELYANGLPAYWNQTANTTYRLMHCYLYTTAGDVVNCAAASEVYLYDCMIDGAIGANVKGIMGEEHTLLTNYFQYPAPGTDWTPTREGAYLAASLAGKTVWIVLDVDIGDYIVSYTLVGDATEAAALTLDCQLYSVNLANPLTTTAIAGGVIVQVDADGNFDVLATLTAPELIVTDKQYVLELLGTTGVGDCITVMGAEVLIR